MLIAWKIILMVILVLFAMGALAEAGKESGKVYAAITIAALIAGTITFYFL